MSPVKESEQRSLNAFCTSCGSFLLETRGNMTTSMVCPYCGRDLIVSVKNGKVSVSEDTDRAVNPPGFRRRMRMICYTNRVRDKT